MFCNTNANSGNDGGSFIDTVVCAVLIYQEVAMFEILHVKGNTYCIDTGMTYIPFYKVNQEDIILLDSGWARGERERLVELFDFHHMRVSAIINTHSHIDHAGNNAYFKSKYNCIISMSAFSASVCSSATHLKLYYNRYTISGVKKQYGDVICDTDIIIDDHQTSVLICGIKFGVLHTPGHSPGHICLITPDDVAYLGDALITDVVMTGTKLPYAFMLDDDLKSKLNLLHLKCDRYIIAHKGVVEDIKDLVQENIDYYTGRAKVLLRLITGPMTIEEILKAIVKEWNIKIQSTAKYHVVERMLRYYVEYLVETGAIEMMIDDGFLKYVRVA